MKDYRNDTYKNLSGYIPGEQPQSEGWIKLNTNENPYPPSPAVLDVLKYFFDNPGLLRKYPSPNGEPLRSSLAVKFNMKPENILVTNGSDEALSLICRIFLGPGKKAAAPEITYSLYDTLARSTGAEYVSAPMTNYETLNISLDALEETNADVFFLSNPNAQTGEYIHLNTLKEHISKSDKLWIIDEAYNDFAGDFSSLPEDPSFLSVLKNFNNVIVVRTFSKSHSLAGMRIGYAVSVNPLVLEGFNTGKDSYNEDTLALHIGKASIEDNAYSKEVVLKIQSEKQRLVMEFLERDFLSLPSHANFILVKPPEPHSPKDILEKLKEEKILVRYFSTDLLSKYLRISIGTAEENNSLLKAIDKIYGN
jgi:histidinol-phosphate aminotransferase